MLDTVCVLSTAAGNVTFYWLIWLALNHFPYIFIIITLYPGDFLGYSIIVLLICCHPHMLYLLWKQNGVSQNMSAYHWPPYVVWVGYALYRLNKMMITSDINNILFVYTVINVITNTISVILDLWACYNWYYLGNQYILRSQFVLNYLKEKKLISQQTQTIQWIKKGNKRQC